MSPAMYLVLLLVLVKYLQVVHSVDEIHNTNSSVCHNNINLLEANTLSGQGLSIFQKNDTNINGSRHGEANDKQPSKKKRKKQKSARKLKQFPNVNATMIGEQDTGITQVRSSKSSSDTFTTSNSEQPCEAMVLTYGPIGFTSALDLINNASKQLHRPVRKYQHETRISSGGNENGLHEFKYVVANVTSQEELLNRTSTSSRVSEMYKLESNGHLLESPGDSNKNNNQLKPPPQHREKRHNKQISETFVSKNMASVTQGMVVKRNAQIIKVNEGDQRGPSMKVEKTASLIQENDETHDGNKYSSLLLLRYNLPSGLYDREQTQTSGSSYKEMLQPKSKCQYKEKLKHTGHILIKSAISDNGGQAFDKTGKPCPKQPKFIDKIAIDRENYNNNQKFNSIIKRGIDKKLLEEHFKAKTGPVRIRDQMPSNEKTVERDNGSNKDMRERFSEDNYDVGNKNVSEENGRREKRMEKRYIPQLHPMPKTEDDEKKNDADTAGYLKIIGGSTRFDGKSTDEIKKELVDYFTTWPKTREWLYSDQNPKQYQEKNVSSLPIRVYEQPTYDDRSEHVLSYKTHKENTQPQQSPTQASVYADNTNPYQLPPKSPFYFKLYHRMHDSTYTQYEQENYNPQPINFEIRREADYYPVDYQILLPQYQSNQNSCVKNQTNINENSHQAITPAYDNLETKPPSISKAHSNQPVSLSDYFKNPQTVTIVKKLTKMLQDKDHSKPKLIKVLAKPSD